MEEGKERITIRKAVTNDFDRIMEIYAIAQEFMIQNGNPNQWGHIYPQKELIRQDIAEGICYVLASGDAVCGVFALCEGEEEDYREIFDGQWLNDEPYIAVHRVAGDGQHHGIFRCIADYCKELSDNIRIDTHKNNLPMQKQIERNGFARCGIIYVLDKSPRIAYQWSRTEQRQ